jgi:hypothetical protein
MSGSCESRAGGNVRGELMILLSSLFGANNPFGFVFSRGRTLRICFSQVDISSFLQADLKLFLTPNFMLFLCGQLFRLCFSRAVVTVCLSRRGQETGSMCNHWGADRTYINGFRALGGKPPKE